jgi:hypothetical protein
MGFLYTYNAALIKAYFPCTVTTMMSHASQYTVARLLQDAQFVDSFMADNQATLESQCAIVTDALTHMGVPFIVPEVCVPYCVTCWQCPLHGLSAPAPEPVTSELLLQNILCKHPSGRLHVW